VSLLKIESVLSILILLNQVIYAHIVALPLSCNA
jgi:hypothetical protein